MQYLQAVSAFARNKKLINKPSFIIGYTKNRINYNKST